jgi:hypothetical protein
LRSQVGNLALRRGVKKPKPLIQLLGSFYRIGKGLGENLRCTLRIGAKRYSNFMTDR